MQLLKIIIFIIVIPYFAFLVILYMLQSRLIFHPGKLPQDFRFTERESEEIFLSTRDGENINALFYRGVRDEAIVYFHGNAGDLSGWQFVAEDFTRHGYNFLIIDYRGYGKSSGRITEEGLYYDAEAAYDFLVTEKSFAPQNIIIYGRSVGTGVAVELARKHPAKGLVLEAPCSSLKKLANEKFLVFFPALYIKFTFDNFQKINDVQCPIIFIHGANDTLIPSSHTETLFKKFKGKKKKVIIKEGSHNDLNGFQEYHDLVAEDFGKVFEN